MLSALWRCYSESRVRVTWINIAAITICLIVLGPDMIAQRCLYPLFRLIFGTLYPAYASYKAVRTKNVKEYVKWMMYWIVFALFTCAETFTDVFFSFWFPFYYEIKVILVLWLLSPATKGSSILYRKFVHPMLTKREQEIDDYISRAKEQGYHTVLSLGTKGVNYATSVIMQTAIKNLTLVGALSGTSLVAMVESKPGTVASDDARQEQDTRKERDARKERDSRKERDARQQRPNQDENDFALHDDMFSDDDIEPLVVLPVKKSSSSRPKKTGTKKVTSARKTRSNVESTNLLENDDTFIFES